MLPLPPPSQSPTLSAGLKAMASFLVHESHLKIGEQLFRWTEVEIYYHSAEHPDPFTHCDPVQGRWGEWYFHRTSGGLRGGTFKGIDLTIGSATAWGGILIRGMANDSYRVEGPSLVVDAMIQFTRSSSLAQLWERTKGIPAWDASNPLQIIPARNESLEQVFCPRVGLSLKKATPHSHHWEYIGRHYRLLVEPLLSKKGRLQTMIGLYVQGYSAEEISKRTGSPIHRVQEVLSAFNQGETFDPKTLIGQQPNPNQLAQLYGWSMAQGYS